MRRRTATLGTIGLVVAACALTAGGQDELPPLTAPLEVSIPDDPEPEPEAKAAESRRPVLMVPGLPRPRSRVVAKPVVEEAELPSLDPIDDGLPPLVGPADEIPEMELDPEPIQEPAPGLDLPDDAPPPLTLEAEPSDAEHAPSATVATPKQPARPVPAPRRRLFGLLPPLRPRNDPRPATSPKIEFDPRSDPAADAALKQRVERVIRQSAGPHVRAAEVSVVDRSIVIRARVDRFFNRRSVKRRLESLPGLAGYQTRVEIVD